MVDTLLRAGHVAAGVRHAQPALRVPQCGAGGGEKGPTLCSARRGLLRSRGGGLRSCHRRLPPRARRRPRVRPVFSPGDACVHLCDASGLANLPCQMGIQPSSPPHDCASRLSVEECSGCRASPVTARSDPAHPEESLIKPSTCFERSLMGSTSKRRPVQAFPCTKSEHFVRIWCGRASRDAATMDP